jgi:structure-specific recognition protein 1
VLRSFDITVKLSTELEHTFTSVNKDEYKHVKEYLTSKKVRVHEIGEDTSRRALEALDLGSEEELDDSDEDRRGKTKPQGRRGGEDEDEDSGESGSTIKYDVSRLCLLYNLRNPCRGRRGL